MQDLSNLKIDRSPSQGAAKRRRPGRANPWLWRVAALVILASVVALFSRPIFAFIDGIRLPKVNLVLVQETHPATVGAVGVHHPQKTTAALGVRGSVGNPVSVR